MEAQELPPSSKLADIVTWFEINWKPVALGIVAAGVLGLVFVIAGHQSETKRQAATAELLAAGIAATPGKLPSIESLKAVETKFPDSAAAINARYLEAARLFTNGDYAGAETAFREVASQSSVAAVRAGADYGLAACLESTGKTEEALAAYQQVTTSHGDSAVAKRAKFAEARLHEKLGRPEQAFAIYQELSGAGGMGQFGQSPIQMDVFMAMRRLIETHPGLISTNAPAGDDSTG